MKNARVKISFEIESTQDAERVFDALADRLHSSESMNSHLRDLDISAQRNKFWISITGSAKSIEEAVAEATTAIKSAIEAAEISEAVLA